MKPVSVQVAYRVRGEETKVLKLDPSNVEQTRIGLASGVNPVKPEAGSYVYSGMHDQGVLQEPKEGGVMGDLISCVVAAKEANNKYLTHVIEQEKSRKKEETESPDHKKPKTSSPDA
eukprot:CAMPEP_0198151390 /NCGR_PEP_ID=MMETSP1443-20131203/55520_1 /TAXON_ID=186043 /ORGANISM="Entomoneis sp., Strain CCMP2396" /LENGTH=116 /DNA_ID=CAMNT_0043817037 /DNA_START=46 /DNA_END=396 /DNA_ORIENTATION=-